MKLLKKIAAVMAVAFVAGFAFADVPEFTEAPNAYVVDAKSVKGVHADYTQIVNFTKDVDTTFTVYGWNKKDGWKKIGTSVAQKYGNSVLMDTEYDHKLNKFTAFAIAADNGKTYEYEYTKFVINMYVVRHNVGAFRVYEKTDKLPKNAYAFESASVKGSFKDRIKVQTEDESNSLDGKAFVIYGSDDNENWAIVAGGTISKESSYLESVNEDKVAKYKFYAISNLEGKSYEYTVTKSHNDLYFTVK